MFSYTPGAPIATELPEEFNSVLWCRRWKGALSLGNITRAMDIVYVAPIFLYTPPIA
jgi:Ca2+/Na+ antiporter